MTISAQGYLGHLKSYLNTKHYGRTCLAKECKSITDKQIILSEELENSKERRKILLNFEGEAFAIKLDQGKDPLYHFLENEGHLWSKRCDFVIFHSINSKLNAYCIEFKEATTRIPDEKIMLQLKASEAWCSSLNRIIAAYVGETRKINLTKYVFTGCRNPDPDLDEKKEYLKKYPSIRHYLFDDIDGKSLSDLKNKSVKTIN